MLNDIQDGPSNLCDVTVLRCFALSVHVLALCRLQQVKLFAATLLRVSKRRQWTNSGQSALHTRTGTVSMLKIWFLSHCRPKFSLYLNLNPLVYLFLLSFWRLQYHQGLCS
jgi:hypothetical protein